MDYRKVNRFWPTLLIAALVSLAFVYPAQAAGDADRGRAMYEGHCASCHGMNGDGNGPEAAALNPAPTNFQDVAVMGVLADSDLQRGILQGKPNTAMRGYGTILSPQDLEDVIAYLRSLSQ
jgi:mono/diheme cytochrome c family protein